MNAIDVEKVQRVDGKPQETGTVVEVSLLLESGLLAALESAARGSGTTTGSMVRRLIREFLCRAGESAPAR